MKRYLQNFGHVMVTLKIGSEDRIPETVLSLATSAPARVESVNDASGELFIESTPDCDLSLFFDRLYIHGFEMAEVTCEKHYPTRGTPFYKVKAQYLHRRRIRNLTDTFLKLRPALQTEMEFLFGDAGYSIVAYDNPFLKKEEVVGVRSMNINGNAPQWLMNLDGTPVLVWDRPKNQEGAQKIARQCQHLLSVNESGGAIEILKG